MKLRVTSGERPVLCRRTAKVGRATGDEMSASRRGLFVMCQRASAFTLVEVMVALLIFFMAVFTILGLLSNSLRNARALQRRQVDCGMVAAQFVFQYANTNQMPEDEEISDDFGDLYPDYEWTVVPHEVGTNGLYEVYIDVRRKRGVVEATMTNLMFAPNARGSLERGLAR